MARLFSLNIITIGLLLMTFCISDSKCKPQPPPIIGVSDNVVTPVVEGYQTFLRRALMDASHVIDNLINKSKRNLMNLPHEDWLRLKGIIE